MARVVICHTKGSFLMGKVLHCLLYHLFELCSTTAQYCNKFEALTVVVLMPNSLVLPIQLTAVGDCMSSREKEINIWQKAFETMHWNEFLHLSFSKLFAVINASVWYPAIAITFSVLWRIKAQWSGNNTTISNMKSWIQLLEKVKEYKT